MGGEGEEEKRPSFLLSGIQVDPGYPAPVAHK